jgi:hypothetical protein
LVLVVALGGGGWAVYRYVHSSGCGGPARHLVVAAAPDIAPAVSAQASTWAASRSSCVSVQVVSADPADVAVALAAKKGASLPDVGKPNGKTPVPDIWVPDSSIWLQRLRIAGVTVVPASAPSIAQSPVVIAIPQPIAKTLGWPQKKLSYADLLGQIASNTSLRAGLVDPDRDAAGLSGLLAMSAAAAASGSGAQAAQSATVAVMRSLANGESLTRTDLLGRFPKTADATAIAAGIAAAPLTEQQVLAYNAKGPAVPLAPVYLEPAPPPMDYPYAVLAGAAPAVTEQAQSLRGALTGTAFANRLASQNLRAPDGTAGASFRTSPGAPTGPLKSGASPDPKLVEQTLSTWGAVTQPGRLLAVLDVSGSMLKPVPTAGNLTREQVTVAAAGQGLRLFDDKWSVGLWVFSTNMNGSKPWKELVPIGPLAARRAALQSSLSTVVPKKNGDTGLYDTVLNAYKTLQASWDPARSNGMVVMTDGQNENPGGLTLGQLTSQLQATVDPQRPIQVILIGIGTEVSQSELNKIAQAAGGGGAFFAADPSKISQIFLQAIALRPRNGG